VSGEYPPHKRIHSEDDSYRYLNIEAIIHGAASMYRFNDDIDNSEEDDLTDEELRDKIKIRKNKERDRRDDLALVRIAAQSTASNVEHTRKNIGVGSVLSSGMNLDALKLRHAKLRDNMDMDDLPMQVNDG